MVFMPPILEMHAAGVLTRLNLFDDDIGTVRHRLGAPRDALLWWQNGYAEIGTRCARNAQDARFFGAYTAYRSINFGALP
ncbi:hypothetical protein [Caballeronia sp. NK8]|uniref:hypothetical protein n=1 Tax=Caballeronia sp. NK8 TaxID=140098 RepID=UPI001BCBD836|nr:hypothetical protein [Caballeronia sp. NK8]